MFRADPLESIIAHHAINAAQRITKQNINAVHPSRLVAKFFVPNGGLHIVLCQQEMLASNGETTARWGVPIFVSDHWPCSDTPAFNRFSISEVATIDHPMLDELHRPLVTHVVEEATNAPLVAGLACLVTVAIRPASRGHWVLRISVPVIVPEE